MNSSASHPERPDQQLRNIVEGALLAAGEPVALDRLLTLFELHEAVDRDALRAVLAQLVEDYAERGLELKEVASGWRLQVREELAPWISRLWDERPARYSRALLETLVLIAYQQPVTRSDIEQVRGVAVSSNIIKTLLERDWVRIVGHRDVPGRPALYGTTRTFLDYFNLKSLDELPPLSEIRDLEKLNPELGLSFPGETTEPAQADESAEPAESLESAEDAEDVAAEAHEAAAAPAEPAESAATAEDDAPAEMAAEADESRASADGVDDEQGDADPETSDDAAERGS